MVGIVIVSHSAKLAEGIKELAQQMIQTNVPLAIAAGIDDPANPFGTDALQIQAAIESVNNESGVVVLMDLGSAILSAEMALEFLPEEEQEKVRLCEAPLVEGAIAAVVEAASGASLEQVVKSARASLDAKISQLAGSDNLLVVEESQENKKAITRYALAQTATPEQSIILTITNNHGLHARPAAKFVSTASSFSAEIKLQNLTTQSQIVSAKSINQVMLLGVRQGHKIAVSATGEDANEALAALQELIAEGFGESTIETFQAVEMFHKTSLQLRGIPAAPGKTIAPIFFYRPNILEIIDETTDNPDLEWQQLQKAIERGIKELEQLVRQETAESASIFNAHLLYLKDLELIEGTRQLIFNKSLTAATAWKNAIAELVASYQALEDSYLKARAADVEDVGQRILCLLLGVDKQSTDILSGVILAANDLTVSEVAQLKSGEVLGICLAAGSATSHSALVASQLGIPMIVGVGQELFSLKPNTEIAIDGATGQIWLEPNIEQRQQIQAQINHQASIISEAVTLDDRLIPVLANIMSVNNATYALEWGADGVGLLRTELLYLDRSTPPTEAEQLKIIADIGAIMGERPLTIRTLDIGADKPVNYLNLPTETNPSLGWRGIRQSLDCPDLFKTQLRAILRASAKHKIKLMFPMVTSVREVKAAKKLVQEVQAELRESKIEFDPQIAIGIMVETPAAVTMADLLAKEVDFFSIGTNDLSQYIMASDRTNPKVATLADAYEPAVLRMIRQTVDAAHNAGITVSVCGQLASETTSIPILLGLGVDELSVNPPTIPGIKAKIGSLSKLEGKAISSAVLQLDSAAAVREYVSNVALQKQ
ncbi:MAG: phosphoenolpyruvate--protein phosphotransferase [Xenococcaceae cyanobacterium MO_188.B29]|nr:phosphoenolpyruvate--protein phosphotransferase [Xenococcaceae cyanobacterium MO_188.B29]